MWAWLERFKSVAVAAAAAAAVLFATYLRGRSAGRAVEREGNAAQINEQAEQARKEVRDVQDQTARMDDGAIADELRRDWVRGAGQGRR
ncbi:hypothetical protein RAS12_00680 [Achromobacter seleniivolatilans]|uniref:Uncharacterized protein n=1 Tax=Achromobacter seleniivolatilans TaxID=3047478 RepID=A0ABY9M1P8_9BURK|nr:hypothetical protein [Achromobacter sp. R39]WMD20919.1 hypothetical protein RAS12_00680 [Achromobacter sp. R39]